MLPLEVEKLRSVAPGGASAKEEKRPSHYPGQKAVLRC